MKKIVENDPPVLKGYSQNLIQFVKRCLIKDAEERWDTKKLMNDHLMKSLGDGQK